MLKFGFVTCVQLGLSCMETLYKSGLKLDLAVTLPDNKSKQNQVAYILMISAIKKFHF